MVLHGFTVTGCSAPAATHTDGAEATTLPLFNGDKHVVPSELELPTTPSNPAHGAEHWDHRWGTLQYADAQGAVLQRSTCVVDTRIAPGVKQGLLELCNTPDDDTHCTVRVRNPLPQGLVHGDHGL